jgi:hypothetical protein
MYKIQITPQTDDVSRYIAINQKFLDLLLDKCLASTNGKPITAVNDITKITITRGGSNFTNNSC